MNFNPKMQYFISSVTHYVTVLHDVEGACSLARKLSCYLCLPTAQCAMICSVGKSHGASLLVSNTVASFNLIGSEADYA